MTQKKNTGPNLEEEANPNNTEQKPDSDSATKILMEEKTKLEQQLNELTVRALLVCLFKLISARIGKLRLSRYWTTTPFILTQYSQW